MRANQIWVCIGFLNLWPTGDWTWLPICGFAYAHAVETHIGFMWATHVGLRWFCPCVSDTGFIWATRGFVLGFPMCVQHGLYVGYPYVGLRWFCPCVSNIGFMWATRGFVLGLIMCVQHRLYVSYPYGFASVCAFETHIGFMWATHIWVCIGFTHGHGPTWALWGLSIYGFALRL